MSKNTLAEALKKANNPAPEFNGHDIQAACHINRRAQLMNGDRQAAALSLINDRLDRAVMLIADVLEEVSRGN